MKNQICTSCGSTLPVSALLCPRCGNRLGATAKTSAAAAVTATATNAANAKPNMPGFSGAWQGTGHTAGAVWRRAVALAFDLALLTAGSVMLVQVVPIVGSILLCWLYFALCESSGLQATLGKRLLKLRVLDANGMQLTFWRASLRFFCRFLSALPLAMGYVFALFNPARQTLHDVLASTRVVAR